jgi:hypothetical protein
MVHSVVSSLEVAYRIDSADRIATVSDGWVSFAQANSGERLLPPGILGTSLWPWIVDPTTRQVYRNLLSRVRKGAGIVRFQFRCDAPDQRRLLKMQIAAAAGDEVDFQTSLLRNQPRAEVGLMDPATIRSDALLTICGWCMRVPVGTGAWLEIEDAIPALRLFEASALPQLSHGMCPVCYDTMMTTLDDPEISASGQVTVGALP